MSVAGRRRPWPKRSVLRLSSDHQRKTSARFIPSWRAPSAWMPCMGTMNAREFVALSSLRVHGTFLSRVSAPGDWKVARTGRQEYLHYTSKVHGKGALNEPARPSNCSLPWESGAEDARTPNAAAWSIDPAPSAKRLECVRFIGAFRPARDSQRFRVAMHSKKKGGFP